MKASDNPYPSVLLTETTTPATPAAGTHRLFIDSADGLLKRINSDSTVTLVDVEDVDTVLTVLRDQLTAVGGETHLNLGEVPVANSPLVWKQTGGAGAWALLWPTTDYTIASNVITFTTALGAGDKIRDHYLTAAGASAAATLT